MSTLLEQVAIPQGQHSAKKRIRSNCQTCLKPIPSRNAIRCRSCLLASTRTLVSTDIIWIGDEPCRLIALTKGQVAIVDACEFDGLSRTVWSAWQAKPNASWYPFRSFRIDRACKSTLMHIQIMQPPKGTEVDHRNGNTLDNRRSNLRIATRSQQSMNTRIPTDNTSGYKGVSWDKQRQLWHSYITVDRQRTTVGFFEELLDAAHAREAKEIELFGEWRRVA